MNTLLQISIDFIWIIRILIALLWGIGYALFLQMTHSGRRLAFELTWLSVVIGVGVDLLIAFTGDYFTVFCVISASSAGIIFRSLYNEAVGQNHPYKAIAETENATATILAMIALIENGLENNSQPSAVMSKALRLAHKAIEHIRMARQYIYVPGSPSRRRRHDV